MLLKWTNEGEGDYEMDNRDQFFVATNLQFFVDLLMTAYKFVFCKIRAIFRTFSQIANPQFCEKNLQTKIHW